VRLKFKQLNFGKIDAKPEATDDEKFFLESFYLPSSFPIDDYYQGKRYYIEGAKGTGKTALLRYLYNDIQMKENDDAKFILYKSDIKEVQKIEFLNNLGAEDLSDLKEEEINALDFEHLWKIYFHKKIVEQFDKTGMFISDNVWEEYRDKIIKADKQSILSNFNFTPIQFLNKTTARLKGLENTTEVTTEISYTQYKKDIYRLAEELDALFIKLSPTVSNFYFFVDELELTRLNEQTYKRDVILIRDLIVTIENLNMMSKQYLGGSVKWVAAIRTEVVNSLYSAGKEINKLMSVYGYKLTWTQNGGNYFDNPLIKILLQKISASEKQYNPNYNNTNTEIWSTYFPKQVSINKKNQNTENYILRQTFMKPRDIVRLFDILKTKYGEDDLFSQKVFEGIREDYAQATWQEVMEELTVKYSNQQLQDIKFLISTLEKFKLAELEKRIELNSKYRPNISELLQNYPIYEILSDLYRVGIIGNLNDGKVRFSYRGQEHLEFEQMMILHESIRKALM